MGLLAIILFAVFVICVEHRHKLSKWMDEVEE